MRESKILKSEIPNQKLRSWIGRKLFEEKNQEEERVILTGVHVRLWRELQDCYEGEMSKYLINPVYPVKQGVKGKC